MEYIKVTNENIEKEHICCAISNNNDIQVMCYRESRPVKCKNI